MTGIDIGIGVIVAISALVSLIRGAFKELVSLIIWVAALLISTLYAHQFGGLFRDQVPDDLPRGVLAWLILFLGTLLIGALINWLFTKLRSAVELSAMDRTLGFFFGLARGCLIVALITLAAHLEFFTSLRDGELWNTSTVLPYFVRMAKVLHGLLPATQGDYFDFGDGTL